MDLTPVGPSLIQTRKRQPPPPSQSPPPSSLSPPSTNYSVVDMDLTPTGPSLIQTRKRQPPPPSQSPPPSSLSANYSVDDTDIIAHGPPSRKRQLELEDDKMPEEFQPQAVSTPNVSCYCNSIYCLVRDWLKYSQYKFDRQTYRLYRLTEKCMNIHLYSTFQ